VKIEGVSFDVVITEEQCTNIYATQMSVGPSLISCTVTINSRLLAKLEEAAADMKDINSVFQLQAMSRHLSSGGSTASVSIVYDDATSAQAAESTLASNDTVAGLMAALSSTYNITATITGGTVSTEVVIITTIIPAAGETVPNVTSGSDVFSDLETFVQSAGGVVTGASSIVTTPSGPPTPTPPTPPSTPTPPTPPSTPTPPTPTPPTAAPPTAAPTSAPGDQEQDSTCAMGANALVLASAAFALLNNNL
jgi:hypothetical protein